MLVEPIQELSVAYLMLEEAGVLATVSYRMNQIKNAPNERFSILLFL